MLDIFVTQPDNVAFPLWMRNMNECVYKNLFVSFHRKHMQGYDFTPYVQEQLQDARFFRSPEYIDGDWRNFSINEMLSSSLSDTVLFLEQDFIVPDLSVFINQALEALATRDIVGFEQGNRYHPAFLLMKRSLIERTSKDFSPVETDHFGKFTRELKEIGASFFAIQQIPNWFHMAGLTQNYTLVQQGKSPNYDTLNFAVYNERTLHELEIRPNQQMKRLCEMAADKVSSVAKYL